MFVHVLGAGDEPISFSEHLKNTHLVPTFATLVLDDFDAQMDDSKVYSTHSPMFTKTVRVVIALITQVQRPGFSPMFTKTVCVVIAVV